MKKQTSHTSNKNSNFKSTKASQKHSISPVSYVHVNASTNNTIVSLSDTKGKVKLWSSSGKMAFKGSKRSTGYAAQAAASDLASRAYQEGYHKIVVFLKGFGSGRTNALKGLALGGLTIEAIIDLTSFPHNGCRSPKPRRL